MKFSQLDPRYLQSLEERYWNKVAICEHGFECEDCCWPWLAGTDGHYGKIDVNGKSERSHRVGFCLFWQCDIPDGQIIRHYCDWELCQQPHHLVPGTQADNEADKVLAGTSRRLFSDKQAEEIRALYATGGWSQLFLANKFYASQSAINYVIRKKGAYAER